MLHILVAFKRLLGIARRSGSTHSSDSRTLLGKCMTPALERQLQTKYPILFDGLTSGFDVGDGWFDLVDNLCSQLNQDVLETNQPCKPVRVKEKLGELRFYCWVPYSSPIRTAAIEEARLQSSITCDVCGATGQLVALSGWLRTRCDAHQDVRLS